MPGWRRFAREIARGSSVAAASAALGINDRTGFRWLAQAEVRAEIERIRERSTALLCDRLADLASRGRDGTAAESSPMTRRHRPHESGGSRGARPAAPPSGGRRGRRAARRPGGRGLPRAGSEGRWAGVNDRRPLTRLGRLEELLGRAGRLVDCPVCAGGGSVPGSSPSAEIASAMRAWLDRGGPLPELAADPVPCHACGGWGVLAPDKAERLRVERESRSGPPRGAARRPRRRDGRRDRRRARRRADGRRRTDGRGRSAERQGPVVAVLVPARRSLAPGTDRAPPTKHLLDGAPPARFERATGGLEVRCSIQLSYGGRPQA